MKKYRKPAITSDKFFETSALACGKTATPPSGSHHFAGGYDTFTGHLGVGFGTQESITGQGGVGLGAGGTSSSYWIGGLCTNWVSLAS